MSRTEFERDSQHPFRRRRRWFLCRAFKVVLGALLIYLYIRTYTQTSVDYQDQIQSYQSLLERSIQEHQQLQQEYSNILQKYRVLLERVGQEQILQKEIPEDMIEKSDPSGYSEFSMKKYVGKTVYIKNLAGIYLSANPSGEIESRAWGRAWEEWTVIDLGDNQYGFKSYWNTYLAFANNKVTHLPKLDSPASRWMFEASSTNGSGLLLNQEKNKYLVTPVDSVDLISQGYGANPYLCSLAGWKDNWEFEDILNDGKDNWEVEYIYDL